MRSFRVLLLVPGVIGVADTLIVLGISGGINLGTLMPGCAGFVLILWAVLRPDTALDFSFLRSWNGKTAVLLFFVCLAVSFVAIESMILIHASGGAVPQARWCIVLGAGLHGDRPSLTLQRRLCTAAAYLRQYPETRAVVSGGRGPNESMSEAEAMRRYLMHAGIASERIVLEERATSTLENLRYAQAILAAHGVPAHEPAAVISSDFHLFRVRMLAKRLGLRVETLRAPTPWYLLPNACLREYFAILKSFVLDRGTANAA